MNLHEHCRNCVMMRCKYSYDCPVVTCELGCGMEMHRCKISDHRNVCQSERISCINSHYGCPANVVRSRLSSHLVKCPANVILCTMEWGRYPLYSEERLKWVPFVQRNPALIKGHLDVELALRDQKVINRIRQEKYKQGLSKTPSERHDPTMKLSYERARFIKQEIQKTAIPMNELNVIKALKRSYSKMKTSGTDQMKVQEVEIDDAQYKEKEEEEVPECPQLPETHSGLGLNINLETIPKFLKHSFMYRVPCCQILHRREFSAHFKNVHSDIHGGLGWMEQHCPFAQYGCPFVRYRLLPTSQEGKVVFSQHLGTFGIKPFKSINDYAKDCYLMWLPHELLEVICEWLDSFSLCNLALTCKLLHHNVFHLLPKRGVVLVHWKKRLYEDGSVSWMIHKKVGAITYL